MINFMFSFLAKSRLPELSTGDLQLLRQVVLELRDELQAKLLSKR